MNKNFVIYVFLTLFLFGCSGIGPTVKNFEPYTVVEGKAYWQKENYRLNKIIKHELHNADPVTLTNIDRNIYGKDKNYVYYYGVPVPFADPGTFEVIDRTYAKDQYSVFYNGALIEGADPKTFQTFKASKFWASDYSRDTRQAFYQSKPIEVCDVNTFKPHSRYASYWATDSSCVYNKHKKIPELSVKTFKFISINYVTDGNSVFWKDKKLADADPQTFTVYAKEDANQAKDKNRCYIKADEVNCETMKPERKWRDFSIADAEKLGLKWGESLIKGRLNRQQYAFDNYKKTAEKLADDHEGHLLTPNLVSNIDLSVLPIGYTFTLGSTIKPFKGRSTYILSENDGKIVFDIFRKEMHGVGKEIRTVSGQVSQDISLSLSFLFPNRYPNNKCLFVLGQCTETIERISSSGEITTREREVNVSFNNGIWQYTTENSNGKTTTEYVIYDKFGLIIYYVNLGSGSVFEELIRENKDKVVSSTK